MASQVPGTIYLLHFSRPYAHARHYLGWASDLDARLTEHAAGRGARLLQVVAAAGVSWQLARTWRGTRFDERRLHLRHSPQLCPLCAPAPAPGRARPRPFARYSESEVGPCPF